MYKVDYTIKAVEGLNKIRKAEPAHYKKAMKLLYSLFEQPFVTVEQVAEICKVAYKSASELVRQLCADQILEEVTKQSGNRLFVFGSYLSIFDKR